MWPIFLHVHLSLNVYSKFVFTGLEIKLTEKPSSPFLFTGSSTHHHRHSFFVKYEMSNFLFSDFLSYCCCCSVIKSCLTFCDFTDCSAPGLPVPHHFLEFAQVHVHWIGDVIQPFYSLLPSSPSAFNLSQHQGLFYELALLIRWPKYWIFRFSISSSNEYSGLISFRTD